MVSETADIRELLEFYKEIGAGFLECSPEGRSDKKKVTMSDVRQRIERCSSCRLHKSRTKTVAGEGSSSPVIMFVGEAPGEQEDLSGIPFVGAAGKLLDSLIKNMGYSRDQIFIGNIIKCRPPGNRAPREDEIKMCLPYLKKQISLLNPGIIVCLGRTALCALLGKTVSISRCRGKLFSFQGIPMMGTYHPSYILHQRSRQEKTKAKWDVWEDMQAVLKQIRGQ